MPTTQSSIFALCQHLSRSNGVGCLRGFPQLHIGHSPVTDLACVFERCRYILYTLILFETPLSSLHGSVCTCRGTRQAFRLTARDCPQSERHTYVTCQTSRGSARGVIASHQQCAISSPYRSSSLFGSWQIILIPRKVTWKTSSRDFQALDRRIVERCQVVF